MPLFDVGAERTPLLVLARPDVRDFEADARALVHEHLAALVGEKLFVVGASPSRPGRVEGAGDGLPGDGLPGDPDAAVVALDARGVPLVVHVVHSLDGAVLATALGAAGRASRTTRSDLADGYPAGPERFHKDVTDFFAALPLAGSASPGAGPQPSGPGARLVVLCAEVAHDSQDLLTFLHVSGTPVQVLRVGVVPAEAGRRVVDVSRVGPTTARSSAGTSQAPTTPPGLTALGRVRSASRRAVERVLTGAVTAVPVGRVSAPEQPHGPVRTSAFATTSHAAADLPDEMTTVLPPVPATDYPVYSEPPREPLSEPAGTRERTRSALSAPLPVLDLPQAGTPYTPVFLSVPDVLASLPARPSGLPVLEAELHASLDLAVPPDDLSGYRPGPGEAAAWDGAGTGLTGRSAYRASAFIAAKKYMPEKLEAPARVPASHETGGSDSPFWAELSAQFAEPVRFDPPDEPPTAHDPYPADAALAALAADLYEPLPLVWVRHRRGERFEAVLHPDGMLETSDGTRFTDPSRAANAVSGSTAADGWRVWRAGESGPTLAELSG